MQSQSNPNIQTDQINTQAIPKQEIPKQEIPKQETQKQEISKQEAQKQEAQKQETQKKSIRPKANFIYIYTTSVIYAIALLACLITNRAVSGRLSWFYIVLSAIALAYCITDLPAILHKSKILAPAALATVMVYILLGVCNWFSGGNWLLSYAYPIATVALIFIWGIILVARSRRMNMMLKSAVISFIVGLGSVVIQFLVDHIADGTVDFYNYISLNYWPSDLIGNKVVFLCTVAYTIITLALIIMIKGLKNADGNS